MRTAAVDASSMPSTISRAVHFPEVVRAARSVERGPRLRLRGHLATAEEQDLRRAASRLPGLDRSASTPIRDTNACSLGGRLWAPRRARGTFPVRPLDS